MKRVNAGVRTRQRRGSKTRKSAPTTRSRAVACSELVAWFVLRARRRGQNRPQENDSRRSQNSKRENRCRLRNSARLHDVKGPCLTWEFRVPDGQALRGAGPAPGPGARDRSLGQPDSRHNLLLSVNHVRWGYTLRLASTKRTQTHNGAFCVLDGCMP